ncbi:MAG: MBL fold metallo-hydrolase [Gemmatimonadota bacterium]|nr:MAG: MBL fold metallo-hydrolase [Gemmatimonadota bacterium]
MKTFIHAILLFLIFSGIVLAQEAGEQTSVDESAVYPVNTTFPDSRDALERNSEFQSIEITYIANEGVLITSHETQILIDALFRNFGSDYPFHSYEDLEKLETATTPYDSIDIVLATHGHGDHFNSQSVGRHLIHNENAYFIGPLQTVQLLHSQFADYSTIEDRVEGITPDFNQDTTVIREGVEIEILYLHHWLPDPSDPIENVGFLITIDGKKILHLGDANPAENNFDVFDLQERDIDVAILPFWILISSNLKTFIDTHIRPKQIIAAHLPLSDSSPFVQPPVISAAIENIHPSALLFTENLFSTIFSTTMKPFYANFQAELKTGNAPATIQFTDFSTTHLSITSWAWDFDTDGTVDSDEQNPSWTYDEPGMYTVSLEVSNDSLSHTKIREDYVHVFDGESAILFDGEHSYVSCPATHSLNLTDALTIEAWINPSGWGEFETLGLGRVLDKKYISLYLVDSYLSLNDHSLVFQLTHADGVISYSNTPEASIVLDEWQHIAVTYNGEDVVTMYINGIEQTVSHIMRPSGDIENNSGEDLFIGNSADLGATFHGIIDEVRIWNILRSDEEVAVNLDYYLLGNESGLVGNWQMNEGSGEITQDHSGFGNNGTVIDATWREGVHLNPASVDRDEDGVADSEDNCPYDYNPDQDDADGDIVGDVCDNCPDDVNLNQEDDDGDGFGDVCDSCTDGDGDGYGDPGYEANTCEEDNCPNVFNPEQGAVERGDLDCNGESDVLDVLAIVNHILASSLLVGGPLDRADCNGDGSVDILDALGIINVILGLGECAPSVSRPVMNAEVIEFCESLERYLARDEFETFMALIKAEVRIPREFSLTQNYPNPFNPETTIRFALPQSGRVRLAVFNITGGLVKKLREGETSAGYHEITWNGTDEQGQAVSSGVYFYRLVTKNYHCVKKMILLK